MEANTVPIQHIKYRIHVCLCQIHIYIYILYLYKKKIPVLNWDIACECAIEPSFGKTTMHTCTIREPVQTEFVRKCNTLQTAYSIVGNSNATKSVARIDVPLESTQNVHSLSHDHRFLATVKCGDTHVC